MTESQRPHISPEVQATVDAYIKVLEIDQSIQAAQAAPIENVVPVPVGNIAEFTHKRRNKVQAVAVAAAGILLSGILMTSERAAADTIDDPTGPVPTETVPTTPVPTEVTPTEPVPTETTPTEPAPVIPDPAESTPAVKPLPNTKKPLTSYDEFTITGHRGSVWGLNNKYPESSRGAFLQTIRYAGDARKDGLPKWDAVHLDTDAKFSKDGEPFAIHDDTLGDITTGSGPVTSRNASYLKNLKLDSAKVRQSLMKIEDVIKLAAANQVGVEIEIKDPVSKGKIKKLVRMVESSGMTEHVTYSSRYIKNLDRVHHYNRHIKTGLIVYNKPSRAVVSNAKSHYVDRIDLPISGISSSVARMIHSKGMTMNGWTGNRLSEFKKVASLFRKGDAIDANQAGMYQNYRHDKHVTAAKKIIAAAKN